ncbi:DUF2938 domain-containing protein [Myroides odoratimimus]|uniref:DUF2938 domain-containing protein n=1 Tax=Myroides odoratimimus TaxID=76832 RepID=UPI002575E212|nr:DUF2938 domain-containing protein [Myroides odoratimimus]MDM1397825.1 DUF2938 domain-containing protein [Myroides odoratimimus]
MNNVVLLIEYALLLGIGATIFMDLYAVAIKKLFNIPSLDYAMVGRWIGSFTKGVFSHPNIMQATPVKNERALGWIAHYFIGISFAFVLLVICGVEWLLAPTFLPALVIGVATTVFPFFMMQPAFGFGIVASKTPKPNIVRLRSLQAHTVYGIGLYVAGWVLSLIIR